MDNIKNSYQNESGISFNKPNSSGMTQWLHTVTSDALLILNIFPGIASLLLFNLLFRIHKRYCNCPGYADETEINQTVLH